MADEIGVAVIGFGLAGRVFHAPFVSAVPGLRMKAIVQRRGDEAAAAYPEATTGVRVMRSVEEALGEATVQMIVVATPNETHFELAKLALEAGKHVVIDKPFAATSAGARELIELAKAKGLVLAPFHNRRWDGDFLTLRKILADGVLGRVTTFESHFDRFRPVQKAGTWKETESSANGLLMDLGPHLLDQALALFGEPKAILASVRRDRDVTGIEDAFDITLEYERLMVYCRSTMLAAEASPRFLVHGTRGSFRKWGLDPQEPALVGGAKVPRMDAPGTWLEEAESAWGETAIAPDPARPERLVRTKVRTEPGDYRGFYASVRDAVWGKAELPVTAETGFQVVKLLEMARESSRERERLMVEF
ncbi:MAG: oxidoreductase [Acidobacteriaceae bacterium]